MRTRAEIENDVKKNMGMLADISSVARTLALVVEALFDIRDTLVKLSEKN